MTKMQEGGHHGTHVEPGGLASSAGGLTLEVTRAPFGDDRERAGTLEFRIVDAADQAVRDFDEQHDKAMHLMVVRRDLTQYRHLHPSMGSGGTWSVPLTFPQSGVYRVFADFAVRGRSFTLGTDLTVPGPYEPVPLPTPSEVARTDDYEVALSAMVPTEGGTSLVFRVSREERPVEDLEPYLGALGHLVVLRDGDLAFLHVHPEAQRGSGPDIAFQATFPSSGRYRLFLQFAHASQVHTVAFTVEV